MTYLSKRVLLGAGLVLASISAVFMSTTLYGLMSGRWAFLGLLIGVLLELVKTALSYESSSRFIPERRYGAFFGAVLIICSVMLFSVWAGNERLIHDVVADEKQGEALRGTRSEQITAELAAINIQLADLSKPYLVKADVEHEREMLKDLQAQAKSMRDRMALTKAAELESGVIADLLATIARKEEAVATANQKETERRQALEQGLRAKVSELHADQVEIASRTSKIESSDPEVTYLILKLIVLVIEGLPIYIFFVYGKPATAPVAVRKAEVVQAKDEVQKPSPAVQQAAPQIAVAAPLVAESKAEEQAPEALLVAVESTPVAVPEPIADESPAAAVEPLEGEVGATPAVTPTQATTPAFSHPQLDQVSAHVLAMKRGEPVSQDWLKKTFKLGGDTAKRFTDYFGEVGLITKTSRGWVRA